LRHFLNRFRQFNKCKFVLGLLIVVCAFQLFYFIPTSSVERDATEYAETSSSKLTGELQNVAFRDARARYLDSMSSETIFSIPGITKSTYSDLKGAQLALGLDLKGGMSTVIEVDLSELILALAGRNAKDVDLVAAINNAKNAQLAEQSNFISLFVREFKKIAPTRGLASIFQQSQTLGQINLDTPDSEVERLLRDKANSTVASTFERLKQRIDKLGVVQPNVSLDANRDLILVEMPGIDNPERARQYLQASAELGFWETFRFSDPGIKEAFSAADARSKNGTTDTTSVLDTLTNTQLGPLLSAITLNNAGEFGATAIGIVDKNKKNVVSEILARPDIQALFPKNLKFVWSYKPFESLSEEQKIEGARYALHLLKKQNNSEKAPIEGDVITKANQTLDQVSGQPQVVFAMNAQGAKKWADMTGRAYNEGQREIAIVLDNELVSAPGVNNGAITGGNPRFS
jgi:SecD/SecF fusion protein